MTVKDAFDAFYAGCKKCKKTGRPFNLSFRSKKDPVQSCFIPHEAITEKGIYQSKSGKVKFSERIPENAKDSRLIFDHGRWYLNVPYSQKVAKAENQGRVISLDPGVRTFMTGFTENEAFKIGAGDFNRIMRLGFTMDKLNSKIKKAKCRDKVSLKKALNRLKWKVWDLIEELHFKTISYLLQNYDVILLPTFETSQMVVKSTRDIKAKTVRAMMTFSFYQFSQRLISKAATIGKKVLRVSEAYTSCTASWTGEVKKIGSAKTITSKGVKVDRDINGARGIFLRALRDTASASLSVV